MTLSKKQRALVVVVVCAVAASATGYLLFSPEGRDVVAGPPPTEETIYAMSRTPAERAWCSQTCDGLDADRSLYTAKCHCWNDSEKSMTKAELIFENSRLADNLVDLYRDYTFNTDQLKNFLAFYGCHYEVGFTNNSTIEASYICPGGLASNNRSFHTWIKFRQGA